VLAALLQPLGDGRGEPLPVFGVAVASSAVRLSDGPRLLMSDQCGSNDHGRAERKE
jgi:hypothetical protein